VGAGSATVKIPVGGGAQTEIASIALLAGPSPNGFLNILATATGLSPVIARVVIPSRLFDGQLKLTVPVVESVPAGPDVSVVSLRVTIGGDLTYYETRHGKTVAYRPRPVLLPRKCPRGGFRFAATFRFLDGSQAGARTVVACPRRTQVERPPRGARDAGSWELGAERWTRTLDAGSGRWTLGAGRWTPRAGRWAPGAGRWTPRAGRWAPGAGSGR